MKKLIVFCSVGFFISGLLIGLGIGTPKAEEPKADEPKVEIVEQCSTELTDSEIEYNFQEKMTDSIRAEQNNTDLF